jgi:methylated-DNA-[protein]-cysteine S-methyltransferase
MDTGMTHQNSSVEALLRAGPSTADVSAAVARATERAHAEGLVDVTYSSVDSPLGPLVAAATPQGLVRLAYEDFNGGVDAVLEHLATRLSPRILERSAQFDPLRRELDEYFEGRRRGFDLQIDWSLTTGFTRRVLQATAAIPFGEVSTYRDVAAAAGSERATRAAGNALGSNPIPIVVPCHRVLRTGGNLGGYTGGLEKKQRLLAIEGILPEPLA